MDEYAQYHDEEDGQLSGFNYRGIPLTGNIPVGTEEPFLYNNDIERFLMSLPPDEGRVMVVRALGLTGEKAAEIGGFASVWIYIRKLKKLQARAKAQIGVAFQL